MSLSCPSCASENTQKLSILYNAGTVSSHSNSLGAGYVSGGHLGLGGASTRGTTQSALAAKYSPPKEDKSQGYGLAFLAFAAGCIAAFPFGPIGFVAGIAIVMIAGFRPAKKALENKRKAFRTDFIRWNQKFLCLRCGYTFIPELQSGAAGTLSTPFVSSTSSAGELATSQSWTVTLESSGSRKINVIKVVRELTGMNLRDSKHFVENLPNDIKSDVSRVEAEDIARLLEEVGATCSVHPSIGHSMAPAGSTPTRDATPATVALKDDPIRPPREQAAAQNSNNSLGWVWMCFCLIMASGAAANEVWGSVVLFCVSSVAVLPPLLEWNIDVISVRERVVIAAGAFLLSAVVLVIFFNTGVGATIDPYPMPQLAYSPDVACDENGTCTQEQFAQLVSNLTQQWRSSPKWLRAICVSNTIAGALKDCISDETLAWRRAHPNGCTPWSNPASRPSSPCDVTANAEASPYRPLTEREKSGQRAVAAAMGGASGAIVCPDGQSFGKANEQVVGYIAEKLMAGDAEYQRQMKLKYGTKGPLLFPDLALLGCTVLPQGTPLYVQETGESPVVAGEFPTGKTFRGVTNPDMVQFAGPAPSSGAPSPPPPTPDQQSGGPGTVLAAPASPVDASASVRASSSNSNVQDEQDNNIPPEIFDQIAQEEKLDEACVGAGEGASASETCSRRDAIVEDLKAKGWCGKAPGDIGVRKIWNECQ